jgi:hypothetical protein
MKRLIAPPVHFPERVTTPGITTDGTGADAKATAGRRAGLWIGFLRETLRAGFLETAAEAAAAATSIAYVRFLSSSLSSSSVSVSALASAYGIVSSSELMKK